MRRLVCIATMFLLVTSGQALAQVPNPSFEESVVPEPTGQVLPQPLLPSGWVFEGSALLFDHTPDCNVTECGNAFSGTRAVAISGPASVPRQQCVTQIGGCVDNPLNIAKDVASLAYSVTPVWRTALPVPVTAGQTYTFGAAMKANLVTQRQGPFIAVRWVTLGAIPLGSPQVAYFRPVEQDFNNSFGWEYHAGSVTAPAGADGAILMLGHSDDLWIGKVLFDLVTFG